MDNNFKLDTYTAHRQSPEVPLSLQRPHDPHSSPPHLAAKRRTAFWTALASAVSLFVTDAELRAQQTTDVNETGMIEEVLVTATKRNESVRDIPASVDAFTGEDLQSRGANSLEEIVRLSPGVTLDAGFTPGTSTVQFRGVTNQSRGVGPRTIGRFIQDVPIVNPSIIGFMPDLDSFDMQTVEFVKGPQGTLFGGSALAGAIRYVPNSPDFSGFYGSLSAGAGTMEDSDDLLTEYAVMLNAPLSDTLALRFAGTVRDLPGFIDDVQSGEDDINSFESVQARALLTWQATEAIKIDASYFDISSDSGSPNFVEGTDSDRLRTGRFLPEFEDSDLELLGLKLSWDLDVLTLIADANWLEKEQTTLNDVAHFVGLSGIFEVFQQFTPSSDQTTFEARIVSNEPTPGDGLFGGWDYVAGVFYMDSDQDRPIEIGGNLIQQFSGAYATAEENAAFFDVSKWFGNWRINLGGRFFDQETTGGLLTSDGAGLPFVPVPPSEDTIEDSGFNGKFALTYQPSDRWSAYFSVTEGFRFGGINGEAVLAADLCELPVDCPDLAGVPLTFGSDELVNWELGLRTSWLDNRFVADVTLFRIDWEDLQIQQRAGALAFVQNGGEAQIDGVELGWSALLGGGFSFSGNATFMEAETRSDFLSGEFGLIPSGTTLPQAPEWTGNISLEYQNDTSFGSWNLSSAASFSYRDESRNDLVNSIPLGSFGIWNAHISFRNEALPLKPEISLLGRNLTDENTQLFGLTIGGTQQVVSLTTPRQLMLRLGLHF